MRRCTVYTNEGLPVYLASSLIDLDATTFIAFDFSKVLIVVSVILGLDSNLCDLLGRFFAILHTIVSGRKVKVVVTTKEQRNNHTKAKNAASTCVVPSLAEAYPDILLNLDAFDVDNKWVALLVVVLDSMVAFRVSASSIEAGEAHVQSTFVILMAVPTIQ